MATFSDRLVALRKERGHSQADIAKLVGRARTSVQGWESEGKEPSFEHLCLLADYFGVTTDYLLGHSDSRTNEDAVFAADTKAFTATYDKLPGDLRKLAASALDDFYVLLSRDMKLRNADRLALEAELVCLLRDNRAKIRSFIETGSAASDALFLSELMSMQSDFKNGVSIILDRLLQADMDAATGGKRGASRVSSSRSTG